MNFYRRLADTGGSHITKAINSDIFPRCSFVLKELAQASHHYKMPVIAGVMRKKYFGE